MSRKGARRLTVKVRSHSSREVSSTVPSSMTPALLTRPSSRPPHRAASWLPTAGLPAPDDVTEAFVAAASADFDANGQWIPADQWPPDKATIN